MEKQTDNEQKMIEYLLGALPEEETERFDEMGFVDDEFARQVQAAENDLVDAYVRGELSGQRLQSFNSYYLSSPKRREKVKFARALQDLGSQAVAVAPAKETPEPAQNSDSDKAPLRRRSWLNFFVAPRPTLRWGFALAAILMLVAGGWLAVELKHWRSQADQAQAAGAALKQREQELQAQLKQQQIAGAESARELERVREQLAQLEQQRAQLSPPSLPADLNIAPFDLEPPTRTIGGGALITIPRGTDYVTLRLKLEAADYPAYRAELRTETSNQQKWKSVWRSGRLSARGENKVITVSLRADQLKSRAYTLSLKGLAQDGSEQDASSYTFRVVKQ